jgi:hypothetical protein
MCSSLWKLAPALDQIEIPVDEAWEPVIHAALDACRGCVIFLGGNGWGQIYHLREAKEARQRRNGSFKVVMVLLPGARVEEMAELGEDAGKLAVIDLRDEKDSDLEFFKLLRAVHPHPETLPVVAEAKLLSPYLIRRTAAGWRRSGRRADLKWRGKQLKTAQSFAESQRAEMNDLVWEFLNACEQARRRRVMATASLLAVLLAAAVMFALVFRREQVKALEAAARENAARKAISVEIAAATYRLSQERAGGDQFEGFAYAVRAAQTAPDDDPNAGLYLDRVSNLLAVLPDAVTNLPIDENLTKAVFDSDARLMAAVTEGRHVNVYELRGGKRLLTPAQLNEQGVEEALPQFTKAGRILTWARWYHPEPDPDEPQRYGQTGGGWRRRTWKREARKLAFGVP